MQFKRSYYNKRETLKLFVYLQLRHVLFYYLPRKVCLFYDALFMMNAGGNHKS
jgi:hypothetical protein